jgi:hypothetical protein
MNDTEMTQEQKDEAQLQHMRKQIANFGAFAPEAMHAAIRTIDALRAINAEYAALATEYQNSDMGENELAERICAIRDRTALAAPADGSADADAADGSVQS